MFVMYSINDTYGTTDDILLVETDGKCIFDYISVTILHSVVVLARLDNPNRNILD